MADGVRITVDEDVKPKGTSTFAIIVCVFASLGGLFAGYDQGVVGGVIVMDGFLKDFCVGYKPGFTMGVCTSDTKDLPGDWTNFTTWYNMTYNVGCIFGAIIGGFIADKLGRRMTIFTAGTLFIIGVCGVCFNPSGKTTQVLIFRFIEGLGVGNSSFSLPLFGAEMAPKELRGFLSGFMQMTVVTGIMLANIVNQFVEHKRNGWRITYGIAMIAPAVVMLGIFFVPESPRWVYVHKSKDAAEVALKRLRQLDNVDEELEAIGVTVREEGQQAPWSALMEGSIAKRVGIAMFLQLLQQATGINPMFSYGGLIFKDIAGDGIFSVFLLSAVNFVSTIPAMRWVDTTGRRKLLLIGAVGMVVGHLLAGILFTAECSGNEDKVHCPSAWGYIIVACSAFFTFNFAISWGPVCWIYPAEIFPLNVRAKAVSLSTMANWIMGAVMTFVVKLFPSLHINGVLFLFAVTCTGCGTFVYFFCPETKGILLEDIDTIFNGGKAAAHDSTKYEEVATPNVEA